MATLQMAYGERNIDMYRKLFAEDFVFVFNTGDVFDPAHPMPDHWELADELGFHQGVVQKCDQVGPGRRGACVMGSACVRVLVAGLFVMVVFIVAVDWAVAECIEYEDYLHWQGSVDTPGYANDVAIGLVP